MKATKQNYAIRIGETNENYTNRKAYACSKVYNGYIDILSDKGELIQHICQNSDFTIIVNTYEGLMTEILGFEIVE